MKNKKPTATFSNPNICFGIIDEGDEDHDIRNFVIKYETWISYNAKTKKQAIEMFKRDGHNEDEILEVS